MDSLRWVLTRGKYEVSETVVSRIGGGVVPSSTHIVWSGTAPQIWEGKRQLLQAGSLWIGPSRSLHPNATGHRIYELEDREGGQAAMNPECTHGMSSSYWCQQCKNDMKKKKEKQANASWIQESEQETRKAAAHRRWVIEEAYAEKENVVTAQLYADDRNDKPYMLYKTLKNDGKWSCVLCTSPMAEVDYMHVLVDRGTKDKKRYCCEGCSFHLAGACCQPNGRFMRD
jgi:hypothetical protein